MGPWWTGTVLDDQHRSSRPLVPPRRTDPGPTSHREGEKCEVHSGVCPSLCPSLLPDRFLGNGARVNDPAQPRSLRALSVPSKRLEVDRELLPVRQSTSSRLVSGAGPGEGAPRGVTSVGSHGLFPCPRPSLVPRVRRGPGTRPPYTPSGNPRTHPGDSK